MSENNPYAAPGANLQKDTGRDWNVILAARGDRFVAQILDGLLVLLMVGLPVGLIVAGTGTESDAMQVGGGILLLVAGIAVLVIQVRLITNESTTWGKKRMGLFIADMEGNPATVGKIFGMRIILNGLIGAIPFVGGVYSLVDILMIFREDRRCLHDLLAGTQVLKQL